MRFFFETSAVAYYAFTAFVPFIGVILALAARLAPDIQGPSGVSRCHWQLDC